MNQTSLELSDQEFLEKNPNEFLSEEPTEESEANPLDMEKDNEVASEEEVSEAQEQTEVAPEEKEVSQPEGDTQKEPEPFTDSDTTESLDTSKKDSTETKEDTPETTEFDYESAYKRVSKPFKANGVDMQVTDPEDMVKLMQMGANYQKKMAQLKPNLKIIKMLEKNELLNEVKLHNLIDLSKKDPKAIAKLIEESDIDPLDINTDASTDYQPTNYTVTDTEYNLDAVLDEIKDSPTFSKTINVVTKDWDIESKATITNYPEIISVIDSHMNNGVFEKVNAKLQQEKALGKLDGIPDVDAYRRISEQLYKEGILADTPSGKASKVSSNEETNQANANRNKQRKAVAPVKQTTTSKSVSEGDFLGLSDDDFMKKYAGRF